jgi:hypothetical protein
MQGACATVRFFISARQGNCVLHDEFDLPGVLSVALRYHGDQTNIGGRGMAEIKEQSQVQGQGELMERRQNAALELLNSIREELESKNLSELAEDVEGVIEILTGQLDSEL